MHRALARAVDRVLDPTIALSFDRTGFTRHAVNFVEERHSQDAAGAASMALPSGITSRARGRGLTYSVIAKATLPNGIWDQIETTIRLGAGRDRRPYRIVQWREGFHH